MAGRRVEDPDFLSAANQAVFDRVGLRQGGAGNAGPPETATKILDHTWAAPLAVGPLVGLDRPADEFAVAEAAGAAGLPAAVSAFSECTFAKLASVGEVPPWLWTYPFRDRELARRLLERSQDAGFGAVVMSLAAPGDEELRLGHDARPANIRPSEILGNITALLDTEDAWSTLAWLCSEASLPLMAAGIRTAPDALRALEAGAHGIVVAAADALPTVAAAVGGRCPVLLGGGVRRGADVLASLAWGADAVLVGGPVREGLREGGRAGVRAALDGLAAELTAAMAFTGTGSTTAVAPEVVAGPVPPAVPAGTSPAASPSLALSMDELHASVADPLLDTMTFLNEITMRYPDAISFAPGRPYDGFFDNEQIFTHLRRYLDHLAAQGVSQQQIRTAMYQYGPSAGQIREIIADSLRVDENIDVPAESVVVTVGAQEAMLLVLRALVSDPEDVVLVASPCYVGITGAARLLDIPVTPVEEREDGFSCADFEAVILAERARGRRPRALYVTPDHNNPSGNTMGPRERAELLDIATRHGVFILEDSPYRIVSPGPRLPALKSLDRTRAVIHLGSFSKTVFPGARVGFVVADQQVTDASGHTSLLANELSKIKSMVTVNTPSLSQGVVAGALLAVDGRLSEMNAAAAAYYGDAMRSTLRQLDEHLPAERRAALGVRWNEPAGGFFLTVRVPFAADNAALTRSAEEFGVIWTPMKYFYPNDGGLGGIRLSTSYLTPAEIAEGTARLAHFIEAEIQAETAAEGA
jgi:(S)-3,5-dihydroxyphenylglycine transaminase